VTESSSPTPDEIFDVLVIGAGPTGLACAIEAQRAGLRVVSVDKGCLCNSLYHYPSNMTFFHHPRTARDRRHSILQPQTRKPTRDEALEYYRKVAETLFIARASVPSCRRG